MKKKKKKGEMRKWWFRGMEERWLLRGMETEEVIAPQLMGQQNQNIVSFEPSTHLGIFSSLQVSHLYV